MKLSKINQSVTETGNSDTTIHSHNPDNDRDWFITGDQEPDYTGRHSKQNDEEKFNHVLKNIMARLNRLEKAMG